MSLLLEKSEQNRIACIELIERNLYAPSVHCGYYSCLQKIIHILQHFFTEEYEYEMQLYSSGQKGNLHKIYFQLFHSMLQATLSRNAREDLRELKRKFKDLKSYRIDSDYGEVEITESDIEKVKHLTDRIHLLIKRHVKI